MAAAALLTGCDLASLPTAPGLIVMDPDGNGRVGTSVSTGGANLPSPAAGADGAVSVAELRPLAQASGAKHGVPTDLILAVVAQESAFKPKAVSWAGAQGLMQLMPTTVDHINAVGAERVNDPFNAAENLRAGTWYLSWVKSQVPRVGVKKGEDELWKLALAGYNGGIGRVQRAVQAQLAKQSGDVGFEDIAAALPSETRNYVPVVMARRPRYQLTQR